jgi:hemerythrin-like metal-binding protein
LARHDVIEHRLETLFAAALEHFADEEQLHAEADFDEAELHAHRHRQLVETARAFGVRLLERSMPVSDVMEFFHKWFINHILIDDKRFGVAIEQNSDLPQKVRRHASTDAR